MLPTPTIPIRTRSTLAPVPPSVRPTLRPSLSARYGWVLLDGENRGRTVVDRSRGRDHTDDVGDDERAGDDERDRRNRSIEHGLDTEPVGDGAPDEAAHDDPDGDAEDQSQDGQDRRLVRDRGPHVATLEADRAQHRELAAPTSDRDDDAVTHRDRRQ